MGFVAIVVWGFVVAAQCLGITIVVVVVIFVGTYICCVCFVIVVRICVGCSVVLCFVILVCFVVVVSFGDMLCLRGFIVCLFAVIVVVIDLGLGRLLRRDTGGISGRLFGGSNIFSFGNMLLVFVCLIVYHFETI